VQRPFQQLPFDRLPDVPRVPHAFFDSEGRDVEVEWPPGRRSTVHVRVMGQGPPLLLLHGLMTSSYSWRYVLRPLGERFTCYAPDLPGNGASPAVNDASYSASSLAQWIGALQRALDIEGSACVGNSMGGYLTLLAALEGVRFSRLLVVHAPGIAEPRLSLLKGVTRVPGSAALLSALIARDPERWCHKNVHYFDETLKSREEARTYAEPLRSSSGRRALYKFLGETMDPAPMRGLHASLRRERRSFPCPLMLAYAREDPMVPPRMGDEWKASLPDAELVWLDQASHFMHVDAADRFLEVALPFLSRSSQPERRAAR
jgi:pimeloyl-ACP methyl ester carboxylesterase